MANQVVQNIPDQSISHDEKEQSTYTHYDTRGIGYRAESLREIWFASCAFRQHEVLTQEQSTVGKSRSRSMVSSLMIARTFEYYSRLSRSE